MFLLAPLIGEAAGALGITEGIATIGVEAGLSEGAAGAVAKGAVGFGAGEAANAIVQNTPLKDANDRFNDILQKSAMSIFDENMTQFTPKFVVKRNTVDLTKNPLKDPNNNHHDSNASDFINADPQKLTPGMALGIQSLLTPKHSTHDIANFITTFASGVATQSINKQPIEPAIIIKDTPAPIKPVAETIGSFLASKVPNNDAYKAISEKYNGRNLTMANCITRYDRVTEGLIFTLIDELGNKTTLNQPKGRTLPAIYGVFMGANSPNNAPPVDLLDLFSAFHDADYAINGYFSQESDYKYISRIVNNFERLSDAAKPYAKMAVTYFSTAGHLMSSMFGSLPKDVGTTVSDQMTKDDLFPLAVPDSNNLDPKEYVVERTKFYGDLEKELEKAHSTTSVMASYGGFSASMLSYEFGNIMVELL